MALKEDSRNFFLSDWYKELTNIDGSKVIEKLEDQEKEKYGFVYTKRDIPVSLKKDKARIGGVK